MEKKKRKKSGWENRPYWLVILLFLFVSGAIIYASVKTSIIDAPQWNKKAEEMLRLDSLRDATPQRGDILAHDGTPLAQTVSLYTAYVDFSAPGVDTLLYVNIKHPDNSSLPDTLNLDNLATYLAKHFHAKTVEEYKAYITKHRKDRSSSCVLAEGITDMEFEALKDCPVFDNLRDGKRSGLARLRCYKRYYPYDSLTSVVLGRAMLSTAEMLDNNPHYRRNEWHGTSGLERGMDKFLFGKYGKEKRRQELWGFGSYLVEPPVRGYDVVTTLDMSMQEIAERNLMDMVRKQRAEYGTAVIMEVATGEIRAIANVEKNKSGKYTFKTRRNYAITAIEPGSVVKTLSMLIAMENGNIDPNETFNSENAIPEIGGYKRISHYKNPLTVKEVIQKSDNRGICRLVGRIYKGRYNDYIDDVLNSGVMQTMQLPLPGAQSPRVYKMQFEKQWQYYAFAQMVFGYQNRYAPISTLAVYNAVANNGRLMQPKILKALMRNGEVDSVFAPVCLNEHFCTPEHAAQLRDMLYSVVNEKGGTATSIKDGRVTIAGKTGTANALEEIAHQDADGVIRYSEKYVDGLWRLAFAGFFPYENPQYSCIVVIDKPRMDTASAGRVSGGVFRAIAEEMYNRNMLVCDIDYQSTKEEEDNTPPRNDVPTESDRLIYEYLNQHPLPDTTRVVADTIVTDTIACDEVVPSVVGWSAPEALNYLEREGFEVELQGMGRVEKQSLKPGIPKQKGMKIVLTLN